MGCEVMGGSLQPTVGAVFGYGIVLVGTETPQDGEGGLCSLKMGCEIMGGVLGVFAACIWGCVGWWGWQ